MSEHDEAADIERDIDRTREQIDETLESLRQKVDPGRHLSGAAEGLRQGVAALYGHDADSVEARRELRRMVSDNLLPLGLIAAGCAWIFYRESQRLRRRERLEQYRAYAAARAREMERARQMERAPGSAHAGAAPAMDEASLDDPVGDPDPLARPAAPRL